MGPRDTRRPRISIVSIVGTCTKLMQRRAPCRTEVGVGWIHKHLVNLNLTNRTYVADNHRHELLRNVAESQLCLVISSPAGQITVVQNGASVSVIQVDGCCCSAISKVDVLGCCRGDTQCVRGRTIPKQAPHILSPTGHASVDQMSTTNVLTELNGVSNHVQPNHVLP